MTTPLPRVAFLEHIQDNVLVDAYSVTLADPSGSYGIRALLSEVVVIPPGVPTVHVSLGMYEFNIAALDKQLEYEIFWKVIDTFGNTQYIYGLIPKVKTKTGGSGPAIPSGAIGKRIDFDHEGYYAPGFDGYDGYSYDLDGDGYYESFDFDNDGTIDAVDVGKPGLFGAGFGVIGSGSTGGVFDSRGIRVGLGGNLIAGGSGITPPPDGIPDVPSPKGTPAKDGTWGGTYGYDGTSGQIPATGGARTNRDNKGGDGFWDGISFEKLCTVPIGPRGQCVIGETLVDSETGAMRIDAVVLGDSLKVYNRETKTFELQRVTKIHINNTKDGKLFRVKTRLGRELISTPKHPFVVRDFKNHIHAQSLEVGMQLVVEPLASKYTPIKYKKSSILNAKIIAEKLSKIYSLAQTQAALVDLEDRKFLYLDNLDQKALTLARLVGHFFGDGSLVDYRNTNGLHRLGMAVSSGHIIEIEQVRKDIQKLGFNISEINTQRAESRLAQGDSSSASCRQAAFSELLYILGVPLGEKTIQDTVIPEWILENKNYLREFLGALYGSEGNSCITSKKTLNYLSLSFSKDENKNGEQYSRQLVEGFSQFGISMRILKQKGFNRQDGIKTAKYMLIREGDKRSRSLSRKSLLQFNDQIGIRYSPEKEQKFRLMGEYQRYVDNTCDTEQNLFIEVKNLHKMGIPKQEIEKKLNVSSSRVSSWLYKREENSESRLPKCYMSFLEWIETYSSEGEIYDNIIEIESFESERDVYDVTMETIFDFVTNGIVTLDCLKDKAHAVVRAMLKDTNPTCYAFSDDEIDMYLESSLWAFNARPTFTAFLWDNLQERWLDIISKGAVIWALYAQGLIEAGREFTVTDNGISFSPPPVSDKLHSYAAALLSHYDAQLAEIKQNFRPIPAAVGIFSVLDISPSLRRLRHLREKRIF